jgi:hypothetical protein
LSHGERETIVIYVESSGYTTEYFGLTRERKISEDNWKMIALGVLKMEV